MKRAKRIRGKPCDLCRDHNQRELDAVYLRALCHLTAPLSVRLDGDVLTLSCYLPECGRRVAAFRVVQDLP